MQNKIFGFRDNRLWLKLIYLFVDFNNKNVNKIKVKSSKLLFYCLFNIMFNIFCSVLFEFLDAVFHIMLV